MYSPWFYWCTGYKAIAVMSIVLSSSIIWLVMFKTVDYSIVAVVFILLLDINGFLLVIVYFFLLREYIPEVPNYYPEFLHFRQQADIFVENQLIKYVFVSFVVNRLSAFFIAKLFRYNKNNNTKSVIEYE